MERPKEINPTPIHHELDPDQFIKRITDLCGRKDVQEAWDRCRAMCNDPKEVYGKNVRDMVISRLEQMPQNHRLHIGSMGEFDRDLLVKAVKEVTEAGDKLIEMQLYYLRSLKEEPPERLKLLLDTSKIEDIMGEAKKLADSHNYSLIATMSMVNDAKLQGAKIYEIVGFERKEPSEIPALEFMEKG